MSEKILRFEKWQAVGNDFIVVKADARITPARVRWLCDRHFGVGGDGVLVVNEERPRMTVYNADGSRPEMCGNGLRCVAGYLVAQGRPAGVIALETDAGERRGIVSGRGGEFDVSVEMGRARLGRELTVDVDGREHRFTEVDVGNPHAVTFRPYDDDVIERVAPIVATWGPAGYNVEFCRLRRERGGVAMGEREAGPGIDGKGEVGGGGPGVMTVGIDVTVWERGVGRTLACGTGACAVAVVACEAGLAARGRAIRVVLPGGALDVTVAPGTGEVTLRGPARRVFRGEVAIV